MPVTPDPESQPQAFRRASLGRMDTYTTDERRNPAEMGEPSLLVKRAARMASAVAQDGLAAGRGCRTAGDAVRWLSLHGWDCRQGALATSLAIPSRPATQTMAEHRCGRREAEYHVFMNTLS